MNELSLFTGAGGGIWGTKLLGWRTVGYVEFDDYCQKVIAQRIEDGIFDRAPIFGDIRLFASTFAERYRGVVDVVTAGFPCQPFSLAGKRKGNLDERNMWPDTLRVIRAVQPQWCLLENVPGLLGKHGYFGQILKDLAESGFDAQWDCISAAETGAPHKRERLWIVCTNTDRDRCEGIAESNGANGGMDEQSGNDSHGFCVDVSDADRNAVRTQQGRSESGGSSEAVSREHGEAGYVAYSDGWRRGQNGPGGREVERTDDGIQRGSENSGRARCGGEAMADAASVRLQESVGERRRSQEGDRTARQSIDCGTSRRRGWWAAEPDVGRVAHGVACRSKRLRALGNGQVPRVVVEAWNRLSS